MSSNNTMSNPTSNALENSTKLFMNCGVIDNKFKNYFVETTHGEIMEWMETCEDYEDEELACKILSYSSAILQYTEEELHTHFKEKNEKWDNWCTDCFLYFCADSFLNDKPIPVNTQGTEWNSRNVSRQTDTNRGLIFDYL